MTQRIHNFSAGPAVLPLPVLEELQQNLVALPGVGASVLEISHRGAAFVEILEGTERRLRQLLSIPDEYRILFLQGGSRLQFSMVPMNLLSDKDPAADFIVTGSWSVKARIEAEREGRMRTAWDGVDSDYDRLPTDDDLELDSAAAYAYFTSNETIQGVQFSSEPSTGTVPLVCDASSDFLSRPLDIARYGLIFACAQKNIGPAGVTIVVIREDLLERSSENLPGYLNYREHAEQNSLYNTPPTFAIYAAGLVARWLLEDVGGLAAMEALNREKAAMLYDVIDKSAGFYEGHAHPSCRSRMNVTFRLPNDDMQNQFLTGAEQRGLFHLKGHRSVGGIRASIYNAMPRESVVALRDFMQEFVDGHG